MTRRTSFAGTSTEGRSSIARGRRATPWIAAAGVIAASTSPTSSLAGDEGLINRLRATGEPAELEEVVDERTEAVALVDDREVVPSHVGAYPSDALVERLGERTDRCDRGWGDRASPGHELTT